MSKPGVNFIAASVLFLALGCAKDHPAPGVSKSLERAIPASVIHQQSKNRVSAFPTNTDCKTWMYFAHEFDVDPNKKPVLDIAGSKKKTAKVRLIFKLKARIGGSDIQKLQEAALDAEATNPYCDKTKLDNVAVSPAIFPWPSTPRSGLVTKNGPILTGQPIESGNSPAVFMPQYMEYAIDLNPDDKFLKAMLVELWKKDVIGSFDVQMPPWAAAKITIHMNPEAKLGDVDLKLLERLN